VVSVQPRMELEGSSSSAYDDRPAVVEGPAGAAEEHSPIMEMIWWTDVRCGAGAGC